MSTKMTEIRDHGLEPLPTANYSSAIARAVEWLGDRYLLAKPIKAAPGRVVATPVSAVSHQGSRRRVARKGCTTAPVSVRLG